ncbi:MAG TPA: hypothetical protein VN935_05280 [Rhizomicrobium sp.]|jgi:hypothetical protein|nr:hypothetical protein [Rhizomicrobium sp.]
MSARAVWMLLTAPGAGGIVIALTAEIGEGTHGIGLRRVDMPGASADIAASAETGAASAAQILYREQFLRRHLVVRFKAERELFNVHGRSADLAFALALAAAVKATQGPEEGQQRIVAATGTLDDCGRVQKIDGIAAKFALALAHLPPQSLLVFPEACAGDLPPDAQSRAASREIALHPVAHLEDAMRLVGLAVFRRNEDEFRQWQDLSREAEQWSRGERALIPPGPQLGAASALYARRAADWSGGDEQILAYVRASLAQRDRRRMLAGLAFGIPSLAAAGLAGRAAYDYVASLHSTRIPFDNVSVPGPDYQIAAGPYLRRFGVAIDARMPDSSAVLIASNIGLYRGEAVDAMTAQNFLTQMNDPPTAPLGYTLVFTRPAKSVRLLRAPLWTATKSGVTHPAWRATALDAAGNVLAADGEGLLGSYTIVAEKWFDLIPKTGMVAALRITSDFRNDAGKPFAGFQAALIQELQLLYS